LTAKNLHSRGDVLEWIKNPQNEPKIEVAIGEWNREHPEQKIELESQGSKRKRVEEENQPPPHVVAETSDRKTKKRRKDKAPPQEEPWILSITNWEHILEHTADDTSKSIHGIYLNRRKGNITSLITEAASVITESLNGNSPRRLLAKEKPRRNKSQAFVIDMEQQIGSMGGHTKNGEPASFLRVECVVRRKNHRLIVQNAFPADTIDLKH
jgi:hypothetical protein